MKSILGLLFIVNVVIAQPMSLFEYSSVPDLSKADYVSKADWKKLKSDSQVRIFGVRHDRDWHRFVKEVFYQELRDGSKALLLERDPDAFVGEIPCFLKDRKELSDPEICFFGLISNPRPNLECGDEPQPVVDFKYSLYKADKCLSRNLSAKGILSSLNERLETGFLDAKLTFKTLFKMIKENKKYHFSREAYATLLRLLQLEAKFLLADFHNKEIPFDIIGVDKFIYDSDTWGEKWYKSQWGDGGFKFFEYRQNIVNFDMAVNIRKAIRKYGKVTFFVGMAHTGKSQEVIYDGQSFNTLSVKHFLPGFRVEEIDIYPTHYYDGLEAGFYQGKDKADSILLMTPKI